ncbi:MAG: virulence associated protein [Anaerotruncus sp.]|nr:virulence associated protein [Anaerotruncus sp.]
MELKEQRFGMELEMTGLSRRQAAQILADYFGTEYTHDGGYYDKCSVPDAAGRRWTLMYDSSIHTQGGGREYAVELVTPICQYADIATIQELVRRLRAAGAISDQTHMCGIHIHVDASPFDAHTLRNLTNIMYAKEDLIYKALQVDVRRELHYCRKVEEDFLQELNRKKPASLTEVERIWYGGTSRSDQHYDSSRYHCLNLHSVFQKGTVEFRLFNGTMHAGKIRAYLSLALAITAQALNQKSASRRKTQSNNEKYTFRTWLLRLGMIGEEFANPRKHLLEHLEGNIAWKDPAQVERQRERNRQQMQTEATIETGAEEHRSGFSMSL